MASFSRKKTSFAGSSVINGGILTVLVEEGGTVGNGEWVDVLCPNGVVGMAVLDPGWLVDEDKVVEIVDEAVESVDEAVDELGVDSPLI